MQDETDRVFFAELFFSSSRLFVEEALSFSTSVLSQYNNVCLRPYMQTWYVHAFMRCSDCKQLKQSFVYYTIFVFLSKFNFLNLLYFGKKWLSRQARYAEETLITCVVIRFSYVGEFFRCYCWLFVRLLLLIIRWEAIARICRNY